MLCFVYVGVYFWRESKYVPHWLKSQRPEENRYEYAFNLWRALFGEKPRILLENSDLLSRLFAMTAVSRGLKLQTVWTFDYSSLDGADDLGCAI